MCVDYTDLNKHCPKDPFSLPRIDEVIDSIADCKLLCFLDCYSGYQRAILRCLKDQIGKNIEAYVDDMVVKSKTIDTLIADLTEVFKALKVYRWKLNPTKCIFGVPSSILLGNIISHCGIEANLEKIMAVTNMKPPTYIKDV